MSILLEEWEEKFKPLLGDTCRWDGFSLIATKLIENNKPIAILETGCVHYKNEENYKQQGSSTLVWEWLVEKTQGTGWSVDIDIKHVLIALDLMTSDRFHIVENDSIHLLSRSNEYLCLDILDLLYLDSMDHDPGQYALSELHHMGELAAAYPKLKSGCLIAIDDCQPVGGKDHFVRQFFERMNIPPLLKSYVSVWQKP